MPARVVSSLQDDSDYIFNRCTLQNGLKDSSIEFIEFKGNENKTFPFEHGRTYDFVRSAGAKIRDAMINYLTGIFPNIDGYAKQDLRSAFGKLFNNDAYKKKLEKEGEKVGESLNLLIFKPEIGGNAAEDYVAHVNFKCNTIKGPGKKYEVHTSITCHKFTWFAFQEEDEEDFLRAFQELRLNKNN